MPAQRITIVPSVSLAVVLCAAHFGAAGVLWLTPLPAAVNAALTLLIAISLIFYLARDAVLRTREAIVALEITDDGTVSFRTRRGEWQECEVRGSSYVSSRLTIINLTPAGTRRERHVILVRDNVDPQDFRRLRAWLRWAAQRGPGTA